MFKDFHLYISADTITSNMAEGTRINTFVFMDLETTGLKKKGVFPEITELFMLSVGQEEFMLGNRNKVENSIKLIFKTETITERASKITGKSLHEV